MSDYTPTTGMVRARYCDSTVRGEGEPGRSHAPDVPAEVHEKNHGEFDRWLEQHSEAIRAEERERIGQTILHGGCCGMTDLDLTKAIKSVTDLWDEPLDDVHDLPQIVNAILAAGYSRTVGTGAGEGATGQDTGTAWVTRSTDCPEAPAQAHCAGLDLTKLREIAEAATPGKWERVVDNDSRRPIEVSIWSEVANYYPVEGMVIGNPNHMADATHIAAFDPPTVLALLDEIERLRGACDRAWWWEEADEDYVFSAGEPYRRERVDGVLETKEALVRGYIRVRGYAKVFRFFRDTRWTPPRPPLKVGDVIETVEDLERLPVSAGVVDIDGDLAQKRDDGRWHYAMSRFAWQFDFGLLRYGPLTVAHLPKAGDSE